MNRRQSNHLEMFMTVQVTCDELLEILKELPSFETVYGEFNDVVEGIKQYLEAQQSNSTGKTLEKRSKKEVLVEKTMDIVRRVIAYATVNKLPELKAEVNYSNWKLKRQTPTMLCSISSLVNEKAGKVLEPLKDYGVTQAMLDEQEAANVAFYEEIPMPRQRTIVRKNATQALKTEFKKANDLLRMDMDRLVDILKTSNKEVYKHYRNSRVIVDRRGKKKMILGIKGKVTEKGTRMPESGVAVSIVGTTMVVMTGMDGLFSIPLKKEGKYILRCTKNGRKAYMAEIEVSGKQMAEVAVEMERRG